MHQASHRDHVDNIIQLIFIFSAKSGKLLKSVEKSIMNFDIGLHFGHAIFAAYPPPPPLRHGNRWYSSKLVKHTFTFKTINANNFSPNNKLSLYSKRNTTKYFLSPFFFFLQNHYLHACPLRLYEMHPLYMLIIIAIILRFYANKRSKRTAIFLCRLRH